MRCHNDCRLVITANGKKELHDFVGSIGVEVSGRFIGKNELRIIEERTGNVDPLLLAAAHLMGHFKPFALEPYLTQNTFNFFLDKRLVRPAGSFQYKFQVVVHITIGEQPEVLEDDTQVAPQLRHVLPFQSFQIDIRNRAFSFCEGDVAIERFKQAAFAGAGLADEVDEIALGNLQVHV